MPSKMEDLTGRTFGVYKVLSYNEEESRLSGRKYWNCECQKCHSVRTVRADGLKRLPKSCPSCRYPNLVGKVFGELTVLEKGSTDKNGHISWICQCSCGNLKEVAGTNLIQGHTTSCGCIHSKTTSEQSLEDLTGQTFGKLTVMYRAANKNGRVTWHCKCSCGTEIDVTANNLKSGHTLSCGCIKSKGEARLRELLNIVGVDFKTEYIFPDLPKRRFDFAVFYENQLYCLIEFHGKQHYNYISTWHQTEEEFHQAQERDKEKEEYCKTHNIQLIIIPYWEYDNLNEEYLMKKINFDGAIKEVKYEKILKCD